MNDRIFITAGSLYLDIDAYACVISLRDLLILQGKRAEAYSCAVCNYSVCNFLRNENEMLFEIPPNYKKNKYIIVDVSDPRYIDKTVSSTDVVAVYDHHTGYENYWKSKIGDNAHIEFIGAAATLIYREWEKAELTQKMSSSTAKLMIAAILDNTLYLSSENTTPEDRLTFKRLCRLADIDDTWCENYFKEVQKTIEADLKNALFNDIKRIKDNLILPSEFAQLTVWNCENILNKSQEIKKWFDSAGFEHWMINIIDIHCHHSFFLCYDDFYQKRIEKVFNVKFNNGVALSPKQYLRKEILKLTGEMNSW